MKRFATILDEALDYKAGQTRIDHPGTGDMVPTVFQGKIDKGALQSGDPSLVSILAAHVGIQPTALTFDGDDMCCNDGKCACGGSRIMPAALGGSHDVASMIRSLKRHFGVRESLDEAKDSYQSLLKSKGFHHVENEGPNIHHYSSVNPSGEDGEPEDEHQIMLNKNSGNWSHIHLKNGEYHKPMAGGKFGEHAKGQGIDTLRTHLNKI